MVIQNRSEDVLNRSYVLRETLQALLNASLFNGRQSIKVADIELEPIFDPKDNSESRCLNTGNGRLVGIKLARKDHYFDTDVQNYLNSSDLRNNSSLSRTPTMQLIKFSDPFLLSIFDFFDKLIKPHERSLEDYFPVFIDELIVGALVNRDSKIMGDKGLLASSSASYYSGTHGLLDISARIFDLEPTADLPNIRLELKTNHHDPRFNQTNEPHNIDLSVEELRFLQSVAFKMDPWHELIDHPQFRRIYDWYRKQVQLNRD